MVTQMGKYNSYLIMSGYSKSIIALIKIKSIGLPRLLTKILINLFFLVEAEEKDSRFPYSSNIY